MKGSEGHEGNERIFIVLFEGVVTMMYPYFIVVVSLDDAR